MGVLARMGYTLVGLALIAPAAAWAGMPQMASDPTGLGIPRMKKGNKAGAVRPEHLCAECLRQKVMAAEKGVRISPAPALPPGRVAKDGLCTRCGAPSAVVYTPRPAGSAFASRPVELAVNDGVGRAVAGDEPVGYATSGSEPAPIGMAASRLASAPVSGPALGSRDSAVMPTSAASDPLTPPGANRPHILSHLFGVDGIGKDRARANERKRVQQHASISYGAQTQTVDELPASVVFGKR